MIQLGGGAGRPNGHDAGGQVERFRAWLVRFGDSWEAGDADAMAGLFAPGALFQAEPFTESLRGKPAIRAHWAELLEGQREVDFRAELLGAGETYGIAHWRASFRVGEVVSSAPPGAAGRRALDGVLMAAFDRSGRCTSLRQWWHAGDADARDHASQAR